MITRRPSAVLIIAAAICTSMLFRCLLKFDSIMLPAQLALSNFPVLVRALIVVLFWAFWISRFRYAKHAIAYLVYLIFVSDILLYFIGLDVAQRSFELISSPWIVVTLQIVGVSVFLGTLLFIKKLHSMSWIVVASSLNASFILGGFIPLILGNNFMQSLIWLGVVEAALAIYLLCAFRILKSR